MKYILSFGISISSIIIGIAVILKYYITFGKGYGFCEGAGWTLLTLGAPTTFLTWIVGKVSKGSISVLLWICFLYLLQYQLIAYLIYKEVINLTSKSGIIYLIIIVTAILIGVTIMQNYLTGHWIF